MIRINLSARKLSIWGDTGEHPYQCMLPGWWSDSHNWLMLGADTEMGIIERTTLGEVTSAIEYYAGQPIPAWLHQHINQGSV